MGYASRDPQPLDPTQLSQEFIDSLTALLPPPSISITPEQLTVIASQVDISGKVDKVTGSALVPVIEIAKIHAPGSDNQDLSAYDMAVTHANSLHANPAATVGADWNTNVSNKPVIPPAQVQSDWNASSGMGQVLNKPTISGSNTGDDATNTQYSGLALSKQDKLVSATNIKTVNGNSLLGVGDISITGGTDPFISKLILTADKPTGANTTPIDLTTMVFSYEANSRYVIDMYMIVAPTAATTGCGFMLDVSSAVTYVGLFASHQLANTGTLSGSGSSGDAGVTAQGVSSGMPSVASHFVSGSGILVTGANAGTAQFRFRSETTAVTTCKAGSMIRVMKMT